MRAFLGLARNLIASRKAATAVEYGFLLALIVLAIMAALILLGSTTSGLWSDVSNKVQAVN